ncbi:MAG: hypothetical protein ABIY51_12150 [Ferruginibacter sp.]
MKPVKIFAAFIIMLLAVTSAGAQTTNRNRVKQGVRSGEITSHEGKVIAKDRKETKEDIKAAKVDGVVTPAEKKEIKQDKKKTSRTIYRTKHNRRDRN